MEPRQYFGLLISVGLLEASCAPPPVAPASATIAVKTTDDGEAIGVVFRAFARKHGLTVAEADIPGPDRPTRARDAIRANMQVLSSNAVSPDITIVRFYRGGLTYRIAPASEDRVLEMAREFCRTIVADPTVVSVRAAQGALMLDELPLETDCALAVPAH